MTTVRNACDEAASADESESFGRLAFRTATRHALTITFALATLAVLVALGGSFVPPSQELATACVGFAGVAATAYFLIERLDPWDGLGVVAFACLLTHGSVQGAIQARGDHEIAPDDYSRLAARIARRPALDRLLIPARADGVVTNAEIARLDAEEIELDRREALGLR